jgi:3-oxoacyl-[acyl-carrier-protein] synthase II
MRRVVVSGLGMVAPNGNSVSRAWETVLSGRSAVAEISRFDARELPVRIAAEVKSFEPASVMDKKEARQSTRFVQFAAAAAGEAVRDSGIDATEDPHRYGCCFGVGIGAFGEIAEEACVLRDKGPRRVSPLLLAYAPPNMASGFPSIVHGFRGPNFCTATACASSTHSIGEAFLHVAIGNADVMLAGGAEAAITPLSIASFARMGALSSRNDSPQSASRPFDLDRDGFVMGEGGAAVVLEELEHARQRGARIYAELVGYGLSADAQHITRCSSDGDGVARCILGALQAGNIPIETVGYINAHGTSTQANDACESAAIERVFGQYTKLLSVSSTKGVTGHCLGAAGAIEAVFTVLALWHGVIPPTANYLTPDPSCRLDYTPNTARERSIECGISVSCGFGGQNAAIAFRRLR